MNALKRPVRHRNGAMATSVLHIPLAGWWAVLKRTWTQVQADNVLLIGAGVAFYFLLALVPALTSFSRSHPCLRHRMQSVACLMKSGPFCRKAQ